MPQDVVTVTRAAQARRSVRNVLWKNASRVHLDEFLRDVGASLPAGTRVLDAGAGEAPYRGHFAHTEYRTADFCEVDKAYVPMDYVCDLTDIPVDAGSFDAVILTQVLEHLPEPQRVLREIRRVLAPGGKVFLTAPLFYAEHEQPYDFYRYTQFGFRHQLTSAGFEVDDISWLEGYGGTVSYQLRQAVVNLPQRSQHYGGGLLGAATSAAVAILKVPMLGLATLLAAADIRHKYVGSGQCKNYSVIAHVARESPK
jgi:hypothetical protein